MPEILNANNFSVMILKDLYQDLVISSFNHRHSSSDHQEDIADFFSQTIKPIFEEVISEYCGSSLLLKCLSIIQQIRGEILNKILFSLDDPSIGSQLININHNIKEKLKFFIRIYKTDLEKVQFNCDICSEFRDLINQILGPNTTDLNPLNADPLLGAWRALDPQNKRRGGYDGYIKNIFSYNQQGALMLCGSSAVSACYGKKVVEAITVYYLATKIGRNQLNSHKLVRLPQQEQDNRFSMFINTLTECIRAYNENDYKGIDYPSCAPGIMGRLVMQCGYEPAMQFFSKKTIINRVINDVVCNKINELLKNCNNNNFIMLLSASLVTGFSDEQRLMDIYLNNHLRKQRYSLFDTYNNNAVFFKLIKEQIKAEKNNNPDNNVIIEIFEEIQEYTYQSFEFNFTAINSLLSNELKLIGYAFSDPAYGCYPQVVNMCMAKLKQLEPSSIVGMISVSIAQEISDLVINKVLPIISPQSLFISGFNKVDLTIIIESYKNGINNLETDQDFLKRILQKSYNDRDALGQEEIINGLDSIINQTLIDRSKFLEMFADLILDQIKQKLAHHNLYDDSSSSDLTIVNYSTNSYPEGYRSDNELLLGQIANQTLQFIKIAVNEDLQELSTIRVVSSGIRTSPYIGPYSNIVDLPDVPVILPYYPNGTSNNQSYSQGIPCFPVVIAIPKSTLGNLPSGVKEQLIRFNININELEVFFCIQNIPWNSTEKLLFRPHPWLYKTAPLNGNYNKEDLILAATMANNSNLSELLEFNVGTRSYNDQELIYYYNNMRVSSIDHFYYSHSFYSFCIAKNTNKAALTLHWLLNKQDYIRLTNFIEQNKKQGSEFNVQQIILWANELTNTTLNSNIGPFSNEDNGIEVTAIEALQSLIVGGQPEIFTNNNEYSLMDHRILDHNWQREISNFSRASRSVDIIGSYDYLSTSNYTNRDVNNQIQLQSDLDIYTEVASIEDRIIEANLRLR